MYLAIARHFICFILCLTLFIACNQSRHIVSNNHISEDKEYAYRHKANIEKLITKAKSLIGRPYNAGSSGPKSFDCSGFTLHVFNAINISIPRMSSDQARLGHTIKLGNVLPGDLLFFGGKKIDHVALVSKVKGNLVSIIHASSSIGVSDLVLQNSEYWMGRFKFAKRVIL